MHLEFRDLMDYTEWERKKCHEFLRRQDPAVLKMTAGPHGDGRMQTIGDIIRHIFMAEKRYVDRLTGQPITEHASVPSDNLEALFEFGQQSRREYRQLLESLPADEWDKLREMKILTYTVKVTPKKIVTHVLTHEMRHWAQIMTMLRWEGMTDDFHDFLFSPVFGGEIIS